MASIKKVTLIVLDSVGVGELPDAGAYGDAGSNTLANTAKAVGGLHMPNAAELGLGNIAEIEGIPPASNPAAAYGKMAEKSAGKDTTTGHWELAGLILQHPFPVYPQGFPKEIIKEFEKRTGKKVLGNTVASGTEIIKELGKEHMRTGNPIVYTSADSVFQVAVHEEVIPVEELYEMCRQAREILTGEHGVGRVIARPFTGKPGNFKRTARRKDFSLSPPQETILDLLEKKGIPVTAVGKIKDIFAGRGIAEAIHTQDNTDGVDKTLQCMRDGREGLIFTNLVDFDMLYGHRNNPEGYAAALEEFDRRLPEIKGALAGDGILIITADHGCDPTTESTDHTREYVPLLVYGRRVRAGVNLGARRTFADVAATIGDIFGINAPNGESFAPAILA